MDNLDKDFDDDLDDEEIEDIPQWYEKYYKVLGITMLIFGGLFLLRGLISLLGLLGLLNFEYIAIVYICCLISLIFTIINFVIWVIALENKNRFDL